MKGNKDYILLNDIEITEDFIHAAVDYDEFTGVFNGNGHTISGLQLIDTKGKYIGLFPLINEGAEIKNLNCNAFVLSEGAIEVMDLIYCPASKNCKNCPLSNEFMLVDEENREFFVQRYKISECRFKIFNNAKLNNNYLGNVLVDNRVNPKLITNGNFNKGIK